ncbi:MAG: DNA polymerase II large subunit [Thermoplasmatota archaeon]
MEGPICSREMADYFAGLKRDAEAAASIARTARSRGLDPVNDVEIPFADDLAGRVENLVGPPGVASKIRDLAPTMSREALCLKIATDVARDMTAKGEDRERALDQATRTGLAILTEGVLVAPLEGIAHVKIGKNSDSTSYADIYFAGPIRAAGGTAQALSVLICDVVRKSLGIGEFKVTEQEIARYIEEFQLYKNLQYKPTNKEIERVVRSCPVCINGEGTEKVEVQGNRDLPRVDTNQVRSGICLVIAEGILLKANKILKITKAEEIKGWDFLDKLKGKKAEEEVKKESAEETEDLLEKLVSLRDLDEDITDMIGDDVDEDGNYIDFSFDGADSDGDSVKLLDRGLSPKVEAAKKYIKDLIAGRPVFTHPSRAGGLRLRYGRGRCCGLASIGLNPYTLYVTDEFMAVGTQIKIERPGKAGAVTPVDTLEGPIVLLDNGDLVRVSDDETYRKVRDRIAKITDVGEIMIPFGEFAENNHQLVQGSYTEDWWIMEVQEALYRKEKGLESDPFEEGLELHKVIDRIKKEENQEFRDLKKRKKTDPTITQEDIDRCQKLCEERADERIGRALVEAARRADDVEKEILAFDPRPYIPTGSQDAFRISEELSVPLHPSYTMYWHDINLADLSVLRNHLMENGDYSDGTLKIKGDEKIKDLLIRLGCVHREMDSEYIVEDLSYPLLRCLGLNSDMSCCHLPSKFSSVSNIIEAVSILSGVKIMERSPTRIGARMGRPEKADKRMMKPPVHGLYPVGLEGGSQRLLRKTFTTTVNSNTIPHLCPKCRNITPYLQCPHCEVPTMIQSSGEDPNKGMSINTKEDAERASRVLKFTSLEQLPDMKGVKGLISKDKIPERIEKGLLRAKHDVFVFRDGTIRYDMTDITMTHFRPSEVGASVEKLREMGYVHDVDGKPVKHDDQVLELKVQDIIVNEKAGDYLLNVSRFVDDELEMIYGLDRYYRASRREDIIGHLAIGLAPHTSAGVLCRIAGFSKGLGCFGHPFYHAAKRRNCDGDEDAVLLLMDGLLNFSKKFLPEKRGGQMDAPLVLSMRLDPAEVDKEAHNVDVRDHYPLDFYRATMRGLKVNDYWMHRLDTIKSRLGTQRQYEGFSFTNDTRDINRAPMISSYKTIGVTEEKINRQLDLAKRIMAVDEDDVAERILTTHLLPDMIGNLRSYAQQTFRCTKCGTKYRRIPLGGKCTHEFYSKRAKGRIKCNNKLILTVSEGSVRKYLGIAQMIAERYNISSYLRQRIDIMSKSIDSMFPERFHVKTLDSFM